jgi:hypothetical protein
VVSGIIFNPSRAKFVPTEVNGRSVKQEPLNTVRQQVVTVNDSELVDIGYFGRRTASHSARKLP